MLEGGDRRVEVSVRLHFRYITFDVKAVIAYLIQKGVENELHKATLSNDFQSKIQIDLTEMMAFA